MPIAQWIKRYEAAWRPGKGPHGLVASQRDVLRALQTYRPRARDPEQPSPNDVAKIAGRTLCTTNRALKKLDELGLLGKATP